jgi:hypothetical protein
LASTTNIKRTIAWAFAAPAVALAVTYAVLVRNLLDDDPVSLLACIEVEARWLAWTCKQVLSRASLTPEKIRELNERGGAAFPARMPNPDEAEEMLTLFLARGVDINAPDRNAHDWTPLHGFAAGGDIAGQS